MTLKTIVQDVARGVKLPVPTTVINNDDDEVTLMLRLVTQEGRELVDEYDWQVLQSEQTFAAAAQEIQTNAVPDDFERFINHTFYNRSQTREVVGPLTPQEWQAQVSLTSTVVLDAFRQSGNNIRMVPNPNAGDTMAFEYISKNWIDTTGNGSANADTFDADTNTTVFDEELLTLGAIWRHKATNGFDYGEEFRSYEKLKARLKGKDGGSRVMDLGNSSLRRRPLAPQVPEGNWPTS